MKDISIMNSAPARAYGFAFGVVPRLLALCVLAFAAYVYMERRVDIAGEARELATLRAIELRQTSDDLSRMVRTYAVTGDPIYKKLIEPGPFLC